jgi:hypothetical protein
MTKRLPHRRPAPAETVLSRGQKKRQCKKLNEQWKKKALEASQRVQNIKKHGVALGTISDLLNEVDQVQTGDISVKAKNVSAIKKGRKKTAARLSELENEKKRFDAIVGFDAFQADPMGTIRQHLLLANQQQK